MTETEEDMTFEMGEEDDEIRNEVLYENSDFMD